jgi:hypothetical protein
MSHRRARDPFVILRALLVTTAATSVVVVTSCGTTEEKPAEPVTTVPAEAPVVDAGAPPAEAPPGPTDDEKRAAVDALVAQYARPVLTADISKLAPSEKAALDEIILAARMLEPIFDRQAWAGNPALLASLESDTSPLAQSRLRAVRLHRGPWDRQDHHRPFAVDHERPIGAGFYPEDITADGWNAWLAAHPDDKPAFESLTTVIVRDGDALVAVPYREAYKEWLEPAAVHLEKASTLTKNKSLAKFLKSRAAAFRSDDYYPSDKDWMDLESPVEVTIGPYEVYEDTFLALKASYEAFVTVTDPAASKDLARFKKLLPAMEQNLPVPKEVKTKRGSESPIRVVDLVFASGEARKSVQTIAFNLPNDERVRKEKGAKKVLLRNAIETKFDAIMRPIAERIMHADDLPLLSAKAFFYEVLFHELSHSLGPAYVNNDEKKGDVRIALGASYSALEEAKADVMGAYNILFLVDKGELPKTFRNELLVSYFAGLFRSVRFGVSEAHGRGAAMQINRLLAAGAATFDVENARFKVDLPKLEAAITELVRDLVMLQHAGDKAAVDTLLDTHGIMSPPMVAALAKLDGIPVDIRPVFPLAGETPDTAP